MASSRKRSRQALPSIDALLVEAQQAEKQFTECKGGFEAISNTRLIELGRQRLQHVGEKEKTCWLFASYPASTVAALCSTLRAIQGGTTEFQRSQLLAQY